MNQKKFKRNGGFTLIEILVVIGIIAILAAIVIIAINPAKQFAQARNTQRQAGVNTILNAIGQRLADNKGVFAGDFYIGGTNTNGVNTGGTKYTCPILPTTEAHILSATGTGTDLSCLIPTYVATLPTDPTILPANAPYIGYDVSVDTTGRITVCANRAAQETAIPGVEAICVTR